MIVPAYLLIAILLGRWASGGPAVDRPEPELPEDWEQAVALMENQLERIESLRAKATEIAEDGGDAE